MTGSKNNSQPKKLKRRPFLNVVKDWCSKLQFEKEPALSVQAVLREKDMIQTNSLEQWMEEMNRLENPKKKFLFACKQCSDDMISFQLLTKLINEYPNLNLQKIYDEEEEKCSLLHILAKNNKLKCLELLILGHGTESGPKFTNVDLLDSIGSTPFLYAVGHNCEEAVAFLLSTGKVNVNAKDDYNKYPLLLALKNKNYRIAEMLVNSRALDVNLRGTKGKTVLYSMVEDGDLEAVKFLIERCNASPLRRNNDEETILDEALSHYKVAWYLGKILRDKKLIKILCSTNIQGQNIMHKVASDGFFESLLAILCSLPAEEMNPELVKTLLNSIDKNGNSPLMLAVKNRRKDFIRFLCECQEVNLNQGDTADKTPLFYASILDKDHDIASLLISAGASFQPTKTGDESDIQEMGKVSYCLRSLTTLLALILSSISVVSIVVILSICVGFYASTIENEGMKLRQAEFGDMMDVLNLTISGFTLAALSTYAQISSPSELMNVNSSLRIVYSAYQTNYNNNVLLGSTSIVLANIHFVTIGVAIVYNVTYIAVAQNYNNTYTMEAVLLPEALFPRIPWVEFSQLQGVEYPFNDVLQQKTFTLMNEQANGSFWTEAYVKAPLTDMYFSFMTPYRDPYTNAYVGYFTFDGVVNKLSPFIENRAKLVDSTVVLIERKTELLFACSDPSVQIYTIINETQLVRYDGTESENPPIVRSMIEFARENYGGFFLQDLKPGQIMYNKFNMNGKTQAFQIGRLVDPYGLDIVIIQAMSMEYFFHMFYISLPIIFSISLLLICFSIVVSFITAKLFMTPIQKIISQAENIKLLQLEKVKTQIENSRSLFSEIKSLQAAYLSMIQRMQQFKAFIPSHILSVIEAELEDINVQKEEEEKEKRGANSDTGLNTHSISSFIPANKGAINRALKSNMACGVITAMTIEFPDLSNLLETYSGDDVSESMDILMQFIRESAHKTNAQIVYFNVKRCVMVWNSLIYQSNHKQLACKTAQILIKKVSSSENAWFKKDLPVLSVSIGISSGTGRYGNVGSTSSKLFVALGRPIKSSERLCTYNNDYGVCVLVTKEIYESVHEEYYLRPIDKLEVTEGEEELVYELGGQKSQDNWAYELNSNPDQKEDKWKEYCQAFEFYQKDMFSEALTHFISYMEKHPDDIVAKKWIEECKNNISSLSSTRTEDYL